MSEQYERIVQLIAQQKLPLIRVANLLGITQDEANKLVRMAFNSGLYDIVWLLRFRFAQIGIHITRSSVSKNKKTISRYEDFTLEQYNVDARKYKLSVRHEYDLNFKVFPHESLVPVIMIEDEESIIGEIAVSEDGNRQKAYSFYNIIFPIPTSTLEERRNEHLTESKFLEWLYQIVLGIKNLHDQKVIHRNFKPENVLFYGERVKIGGHWHSIMEALDDDDELEKFYTPGYARREEKETKSTDIYSLGCTILVMLTGITDTELIGLAKLGNPETSIYGKIVSSTKRNALNDSKYLIGLIIDMMRVDPTKRPTIDECLKMVVFLLNMKKLYVFPNQLFDCVFIFKKDEHDDDSDSENRKHEYPSFECVD